MPVIELQMSLSMQLERDLWVLGTSLTVIKLGRGEGDGHGVRFEEADQPAGYIVSNRSYREEWSSSLLTEPGAEEQ